MSTPKPIGRKIRLTFENDENDGLYTDIDGLEKKDLRDLAIFFAQSFANYDANTDDNSNTDDLKIDNCCDNTRPVQTITNEKGTQTTCTYSSFNPSSLSHISQEHKTKTQCMKILFIVCVIVQTLLFMKSLLSAQVL